MYGSLLCSQHQQKTIQNVCLFNECPEPLICEQCTHYPLHQEHIIKIQKIPMEGLTCQLLDQQREEIKNFSVETNGVQQKLLKKVKIVFEKLKNEINTYLDRSQLQCEQTIEQAFEEFQEKAKQHENQVTFLEKKLQQDSYPKGKSSKQIDLSEGLLTDIKLYQNYKPKQLEIQNTLQLDKMDLQNTKPVEVYEENIGETLLQLHQMLCGNRKMYFIEKFNRKPKIPMLQEFLFKQFSFEKYQIHDDWITSVCQLNDKYQIATGSCDKKIQIFDVKQEQVIQTLLGHTDSILCMQYHQKTGSIRLLISGSSDRTIKLWSLQSYQQVHNLNAHTLNVQCLTVLTDDNVASGGMDNKIFVWDIEEKIPMVLCDLEGHSGPITDLAGMNYQGKHYVISCSQDGTIRVWDYIRKKQIKNFNQEKPKSLLYLKNDEVIVCGSQQGKIYIWDFQTEQCQKILNGHDAMVNRLCEIYCDDYLVSGSWDQSILIWNWKKNEIVTELKDDQHYCQSVCYLNDGEKFASVAADNNLRIWKPIMDINLNSEQNQQELDINYKNEIKKESGCSSNACSIF